MRYIAIFFLFILLPLSADAQEFIPLSKDSILKRVDELKALVDRRNRRETADGVQFTGNNFQDHTRSDQL